MDWGIPTGPLIEPRCNTCGQVVRWVVMPGGARVPIDLNPDANGHLLLPFDDNRAIPMSDEWRMELMATEDHPARGKVYRDHRRSCSRLGGVSTSLLIGSKRWAAREAKRQVKLDIEARREGPPIRHRVRITKAVRTAVMQRDGYKCVLCGAGDDLTLDHIFPHVAGGSDDSVNLRVLCRSCNSSKGPSIPEAIRLLRQS